MAKEILSGNLSTQGAVIFTATNDEILILKVINMIPYPSKVTIKHNDSFLQENAVMGETYDEREPCFTQHEIMVVQGDTIYAEGPSGVSFKIIA